jgi:VWFA-related protein
VRVVVRDANGKPVAGLQKEDFELLDRGKEQSISQFEMEASGSPSPNSANSPNSADSTPAAGVAQLSRAAEPNKFVAFYFDTLDTSDQDMIYLRQAADRYLTANIHPRDRVAIFTSDKMLADFTDDPKQIHTALSNLKTSGRAMLHLHDCPDLSDYQAYRIVQQEEDPANSDAWQVAIAQARICGIPTGDPSGGSDASESDAAPPMGTSAGSRTGQTASISAPSESSGKDILNSYLRSMARRVLFQSEMQARINLQGLERAVDNISQMPGQRTVVLVSPGFLSEGEKYTLDDLVDRAVRSQVIISSLDPRGLVLMGADASQMWIPGPPGTDERLVSQRELVVQDVLANVANETGGTFFHNNNNLQGGFEALAGSPVDYVLAFAPNDLKDDGKFHGLKVKLTEKNTGYSVQARSGYYAPRNETEASAEAKQQADFDAEAKEQERIREAMFSTSDSQQLQVGLAGKLSETQGGMRELSLISHLNAAPLRFEKEGGHNLNTVTFVLAVFDSQDNLVTAQLKKAELSDSDAQLESLRKNGLSVETRFQLKPGTYRIRQIVTDSEDHHMTAISTTLKVP